MGDMFLFLQFPDDFFVTDPFQNDFPEIVEECLQHRAARCVGFNRRGTLLAGKASRDSPPLHQYFVAHIKIMDDCEAEIFPLKKKNKHKLDQVEEASSLFR